jgi:hypothetical protein
LFVVLVWVRFSTEPRQFTSGFVYSFFIPVSFHCQEGVIYYPPGEIMIMLRQ